MFRCGSWFGKICCCIVAVDHMYWRWLEWWSPPESFEIAPDFPRASATMKETLHAGATEL